MENVINIIHILQDVMVFQLNKIIIIIVGLILGIIIGKIYCNNKELYNSHGPNSKDIVDNIFQFGEKYYKFIPKICICPLR